MFNNLIESSFDDLSKFYTDCKNTPDLISSINSAYEMCLDCLVSGGKLIFAGNGGSAAEAQHIAAEYISKFSFDRSPLAAIALTTDTSALTAIGNDYGFEHIFSRQFQALSHPNDVFIAYSTSGNSLNIIEALKFAKIKKVKSIFLTGVTSRKVLDIADIHICIPSKSVARIQEAHTFIGHLICGLVEKSLFK